ncbi:MAG: TIGR03435 family protein [Bryobacteraceae bacterium]
MRNLATIAILILSIAAAQTPQFEVASIKAVSPEVPFTVRLSGGPGTPDPGLFTCENFNLSNLITIAYSIDSTQYSGPSWMNSAQFNISAKVPEGATRQQFNQMLQNLLADRFQLKFHYEKKEMTQQTLVVGKSGAKLKKSEASEVSMRKSSEDGQTIMRAVDASMTQLAGQLSGELNQRVIDATGLPGNYDFTMHWTEGTSAEEGGSPLYEALEKQLGLKLEKKKVLVDMLVVDHIEKAPTEN